MSSHLRSIVRTSPSWASPLRTPGQGNVAEADESAFAVRGAHDRVRLPKTLDHVQGCRLDEIGRVRVERQAFR